MDTNLYYILHPALRSLRLWKYSTTPLKEQEINTTVVEGPQERYQFTWLDKKKSVVLANAPIAKTLRLDRSRSVGRDGTRGSIDSENIYIEGDKPGCAETASGNLSGQGQDDLH